MPLNTKGLTLAQIGDLISAGEVRVTWDGDAQYEFKSELPAKESFPWDSYTMTSTTGTAWTYGASSNTLTMPWTITTQDYWTHTKRENDDCGEAQRTPTIPTKGKLKRGKNKEDSGVYLYQVFVVSKKRAILLNKVVVAEGCDDAKFVAEVDICLRENALTPKDVTVIVNQLGSIAVEKEVQKVKIVEKE